MREKPAGLDETELSAALRAGWGINAPLRYLPVGAGSYHWAAGDEWFVKVDRDSSDLRQSFRTASALHRDAGLEFVVAPLPTIHNTLRQTLTPPYVVSLFPMIDGEPGDFGPHPDTDLPAISDLLSRLHRATTVVEHLAPRADPRLPGRAGLEKALRELDRPWTAGPYAEPARRLSQRHAGLIHDWLTEFDRLAHAVRKSGPDLTVTHGEPHPGNVLRTTAGPRLIDWTTVRLAPRERDLWMLAHMLGAEPVDLGVPVDHDAIAFYRRWWVLADVAAFLGDLRAPHGQSADVSAALTYLTGYLEAT